MTVTPSVRLVIIGTGRIVCLQDGVLAGARLAAGRDFQSAVRPLEPTHGTKPCLLGVYSDPAFFAGGATHEFVVAFVTTVSDTPTGFACFSESELPSSIPPGELRMIYDALCFVGLPFVR